MKLTDSVSHSQLIAEEKLEEDECNKEVQVSARGLRSPAALHGRP